MFDRYNLVIAATSLLGSFILVNSWINSLDASIFNQGLLLIVLSELYTIQKRLKED